MFFLPYPRDRDFDIVSLPPPTPPPFMKVAATHNNVKENRYKSYESTFDTSQLLIHVISGVESKRILKVSLGGKNVMFSSKI